MCDCEFCVCSSAEKMRIRALLILILTSVLIAHAQGTSVVISSVHRSVIVLSSVMIYDSVYLSVTLSVVVMYFLSQ